MVRQITNTAGQHEAKYTRILSGAGWIIWFRFRHPCTILQAKF